MKTKIVLFMSMLVMGTGLLSSCNNKEKAKEEAGTYYTCPMHPEVKEKKPGQCPVCNMDLEKADNKQ